MPSTWSAFRDVTDSRTAVIDTDKSRVMARNRLVSPSQRIWNRHKCTCDPFYQSPTRSEEPPSYTEYHEEDEFTDAEDAIQGYQDHEDEDGFADSDWDEHATLIALLDDGYSLLSQPPGIASSLIIISGRRLLNLLMAQLSLIDFLQHSLLVAKKQQDVSGKPSFRWSLE
jgi:hypothetical protein